MVLLSVRCVLYFNVTTKMADNKLPGSSLANKGLVDSPCTVPTLGFRTELIFVLHCARCVCLAIEETYLQRTFNFLTVFKYFGEITQISKEKSPLIKAVAFRLTVFTVIRVVGEVNYIDYTN